MMISARFAKPSQGPGRPLSAAWRALLAASGVSVSLALTAAAQPALARAPTPYWRLSSRSAPTNLPLAGEALSGAGDEGVKGEGMIVVSATNLGDADVNGRAKPVTITDQLPQGVEAIKVEGFSGAAEPGAHRSQLSCETSPAELVSCTFAEELPPFEQLEVKITVKSTTSVPSQLAGEVTVTGGEAEQATLEQKLEVKGGPTTFGVEAFELTPEEEDGSRDIQAGSHPFQLTTTFDLDQTYGVANETSIPPTLGPTAPALQRELSFRLPPGLIGDPKAVPQCSDVDFGALDEELINSCPDDTAVGVAAVTFDDPVLYGFQTWSVPVFNLPPAPGEPARFGLSVVHVPVILNTAVRSGEDYGVTVTVHDTSQAVQILGAQVTLWGVPGDPSHDDARGWNCLGDGHWVAGYKPGSRECQHDEFSNPAAFLTLPTSCSALQSSVTGEAWSGQTLEAKNEPPTALEAPPLLSGCKELPFSPSISVRPDEHAASTPSGMTVEVTVPQQTTLAAGELADADIKDTSLELPEGVQASAGAANGLQTCSAAQIGFNEPTNGNFSAGLPESAQRENDDFSPTLPEPTAALPEPPCPQASRIGTVEVQTPLLSEPLHGSVYLAYQDTNPFASPLVLYLIAQEATSKVLVKLAGEVHITEAGQLVSTFRNTPPVPFERLTLHLFNGPRAAQATPAACGAYHAGAAFTPSSEGEAALAESSPGEFQITEGPSGGPCPSGPLPFSPTLTAGATDAQAGAFTPFQLTLARPDGDQALSGLEIHLPAGAAAMLASVTPCPIARADAAQCAAESEIGQSRASAGLGTDPFTLPGSAYLTEGFDGAPFGISVVTPATNVGPFNVGTIIANSTIRVNQNTAAATISTVESRILEAGGHATVMGSLPSIIKGVPVQLKALEVTVDRERFQFNPTSCAPMAVTATLTGSEGTNAALSSPFQVANCQNLPFKPTITAATQGKTSKANGASLDLKFKSKTGEAHVAKTILTIPATLPARLTTIQKACLAAVFETNPAACPEGSVIGNAIVHTQVLKRPLTGPIYLVSHGNAAWPDAELVLQGEGINVILDGQTAIKKGVTTSSFLSVPDVPFETVEATLPEGPHSALTMNPNLAEKDHYTLCGQNLTIPAALTGQNGTLVNENVKVAVQGCSAVKASKTKSLTRAQKLALALKACRKHYKHSRVKLSTCERQARKRYSLESKSSKRRAHKT